MKLTIAVVAISSAGLLGVLFGWSLRRFFSRRRPFQAFHAVHEAMLGVDNHGVIRFFNPRCETMFHRASEDLVGRAMAEIFPTIDFRGGLEKTGLIGASMSVNAQKGLEGVYLSVTVSCADAAIPRTDVYACIIRDMTGTLAYQQRLEQSNRELELLHGIRAAQAGLHDVVGGHQNLSELSSNVTRYVTELLAGVAAAMYIDLEFGAEHTTEFNSPLGTQDAATTAKFDLVATFALQGAVAQSFTAGQGFLGVCAERGEAETITDIGDDYIGTSSGVVELRASVLLAMPLRFDGATIAVVEIGLCEKPARGQLEALLAVEEPLALALGVALSRAREREVMRESRRRAKRLEQGRKQLGDQSVELQLTAAKLQKSESELLQRANALERANHDLQAQSVALHNKNEALISSTELLRAQRRELESLNDFQQNFLANMSHELRTPLNSIISLSGSLHHNRDGNLSESQLQRLQIVNDAGRALDGKVSKLLDLARVESGDVHLAPESVEFEGWLRAFGVRVEVECKGKGLGVQFDFAKDLPAQLTTDPFWAGQIILTLLQNAIHNTSAGTITVSTSRPSPAQCSSIDSLNAEKAVKISVKDSGGGVPEHKRGALFSGLGSAEEQNQLGDREVGLGLSLVYALAQNLGGTVFLEDTSEQGSLFSLVLPEQTQATKSPKPEMQTTDRRRDAAPPSLLSTRSVPAGRQQAESNQTEMQKTPQAPPPPTPPPTFDNLAGRLVLLADNNMRDLFRLSSALQAGGATVITAVDFTALGNELGRIEALDLIIADTAIDGCSPSNLAATVAAATCGEPQMVVFSDLGSVDGDEHEADAAAIRQISKPLDLAALAQLLSEMLGPKDSDLLMKDEPWPTSASTLAVTKGGQ